MASDCISSANANLHRVPLPTPNPQFFKAFNRVHSSQSLLTATSFRTSKLSVPIFCVASATEQVQKALTLGEICGGYVPEYILQRAEEVGFVEPTDVQQQALPILLSGRDCILHAQAEPPTIIVATMGSLCQMIEKHLIKLEAMKVLVIDEVDFMFNSSKEVSSLRKLLTKYSSIHSRQTVLASASIPQHKRFLYDCIQQKWTKSDVMHVHVNPVDPMPSRFHHRLVICNKKNKLQTLLSLLETDEPKCGIIFVGEQSEKSKKAGNDPSTTLVINFLITTYKKCSEILLLEEDMNFNSRATSLLEVRQGGSCLLVSTDIAARGVDLPETTHIYNFDLPRTAVDYIHRAGRTGRKPFSDETCTVTNMITAEERFALQRYENELMFHCEELSL